MSKQLKIFSAGVAMEVAARTVEKWNTLSPDFPAQMTKGGSVDGIRKFLAGEKFDVLILADDTNIDTWLRPQQTSGYVVFAGNKMVLAASPEKPGLTITADNWEEKILDPKVKFLHFDPHGDPGGYRAVMTMMLADRYKEGLSKELLNHPGRISQKPGPKNQADKPDFDYFFVYYSMAKNRGLSFAELPPVMDLSQESLAQIYAEVKFEVDEKTSVIGTPISHALTIPQNSDQPQMARVFSELFLENDFLALNFLPRHKTVGTGLRVDQRGK